MLIVLLAFIFWLVITGKSGAYSQFVLGANTQAQAAGGVVNPGIGEAGVVPTPQGQPPGTVTQQQMISPGPGLIPGTVTSMQVPGQLPLSTTYQTSIPNVTAATSGNATNGQSLILGPPIMDSLTAAFANPVVAPNGAIGGTSTVSTP